MCLVDGEPDNLATLRSTQSKRTLLVRAQIFRVFWFSRSNGDDLQLWKLLLHRLRLRRGFQLNTPLITALRMIKSFKYRKAIRNWRRQAVCFSQINLNQLRLTKVERKICFHDCVLRAALPKSNSKAACLSSALIFLVASKKRRCGSAASKKKTCKSYFNLHPQGEEIAASTELCKLRAMKIFCVFKMLDLRRAKDGKTKQNLFAYRWWLLSCASEANAYLMEGKSRNNVSECRLEFCASFKVTFNWDARLNAFRFHWNSQRLNVNCCEAVRFTWPTRY